MISTTYKIGAHPGYLQWQSVGQPGVVLSVSNMAVGKPYYLTVRQFASGNYAGNQQDGYILHSSYSTTPQNYLRAFEILQKDLIALFESVEPADRNLQTYSFRTHELLMRACMELEANFKAILKANTYSKNPSKLNIADYFKIDKSHFLSDYEVKLPYWTGNRSVWKPFESWRTNVTTTSPHKLTWYQAYNAAKHDRAGALVQANLENLLCAITGLEVVLSAQYYVHDFGPINYLIRPNYSDGFEPALGGYFSIKFPQNMPQTERYDFAWSVLQQQGAQAFQKFDYDQV